MLRENENGSQAAGMDKGAGVAPDELALRKAGARRTAWIVAAIAVAFFIASLLQGHFFHIPA